MDLKEIISTALSTKIERRSKQQIELWNTKRIRDTHSGRPLKKYIDSVKFFSPTESSRISRIRRELTLFLPPSFSSSFYPLFLLPRSNTNFTDTAASYRGKNLVAWYCIRAGRESARLFPQMQRPPSLLQLIWDFARMKKWTRMTMKNLPTVLHRLLSMITRDNLARILDLKKRGKLY